MDQQGASRRQANARAMRGSKSPATNSAGVRCVKDKMRRTKDKVRRSDAALAALDDDAPEEQRAPFERDAAGLTSPRPTAPPYTTPRPGDQVPRRGRPRSAW